MRRAALFGFAMAVSPTAALAQAVPGAPSGAQAPAPAPSAPPSVTGKSSACVERIPEGKQRPKLSEKIETRGTSGHAHRLELTVEHGPGETVLPAGFRIETGSDEFKALEASRFFLPDASGPAAPRLERTPGTERASTKVQLWFVPLPDKPGRNVLTLPPLPISIARASGEIMTLCTAEHTVTFEDPIANDPNPKPKANPAPRRQLEEWTTAKHVAIAALIALVVGALLAWLFSRWAKRPRPIPPPPPPRPAGDVALEALFDLRHSGLLDEQRFIEFYGRVSDILRRYLGDRYGYDGLESTTREALAALRRIPVQLELWIEIQRFMQEADLVKFARSTPTRVECTAALDAAEAIVGRSRPAPSDIAVPQSAAEPAPEGAS